jgi:hypothetical protein
MQSSNNVYYLSEAKFDTELYKGGQNGFNFKNKIKYNVEVYEATIKKEGENEQIKQLKRFNQRIRGDMSSAQASLNEQDNKIIRCKELNLGKELISEAQRKRDIFKKMVDDYGNMFDENEKTINHSFLKSYTSCFMLR